MATDGDSPLGARSVFPKPGPSAVRGSPDLAHRL